MKLYTIEIKFVINLNITLVGFKMDDTVIVIRYNGRFVMNETERKWEYLNGRNKARIIKTNCTYQELQDIVSHTTHIDRNGFQIIMKYIFHSSYMLDPIEIENDGDVQCFIKEQFRVDSAHRSPLYVEVSPSVVHREQNCGRENAFGSGSGSHQCSSTIPAINHKKTPTTIRGREIPPNSRDAWGWSPVNLGDDSVNIADSDNLRMNDTVIPTSHEHLNNMDSHEYEHLNYIDNDGGRDEDETEAEPTQHDFVPEDYVEANAGARIDVDVNAAFDVPIVSEGYATAVPIVSQGVAIVDAPDDVNARAGSLGVQEELRTRPRTSQVDSHHTSRSDNHHTSRANSQYALSTLDPSTSTPSALSVSSIVEVGQIYTSKRELQHKLGVMAMKSNYEFKVHKSCTQRFEVKSVDDNCKWRLRVARIEGLDFFFVRVFKNVHECSQVMNLHPGHRQASCRLVGDEIKQKYDGIARQYRPKEIALDFQNQYGVRISYEKAWRARESALNSLRGTPEESFRLLPLWCSMLEKNNPETLTRIETAVDNSFLYFFMALGQSRAGFNKVRPVVAVDGTHLKGKYKGTLYVAACFDSNEQIFPLAFGIGDTENESSYTWFFERFKEAYGEVDSLVFITDRHKGLERAIAKVYPNAYHGHCMYHLSCNVKQHFGQNKHVHTAFYMAAKAYLQVEFDMYMRKLAAVDTRAHQYVMEAIPEKWARSHFPGNRYNIMTTNIAECMNAVLRDARSLPIVSLLESIRNLLQDWFYERRNEAADTMTPVTPWLEKILKKHIERCLTLDVTPLSLYEFHVRGINMSAKVNLETRTCSCREFDID